MFLGSLLDSAAAPAGERISRMIPNVRVCARCIMDETAPDIRFDAQGVCNYCTELVELLPRFAEPDPEKLAVQRAAFIDRVKASGRGKPYDCIVGVSGGVDSSWALVQAVREGLRPLAVHMDNGWNSELAQNNIANLVRGLGVDLYTHVIDWPEYRGLMEAFFAADVIDVELLYDNAMLAVNYQQAARHGLKYILAGTNVASEGLRMPPSWAWFKMDKRNIKGISRRFGGPKLKTFPVIGTRDYLWYVFVKGIRWVSFLNYVGYRKTDALKVLVREFGYKPYPFKHYESVFTRFYQGYILPEKFGVDKRKVHLSNLVVTGEMSRDEALEAAAGLAYPGPKELEADRQYFMKKMGWSEAKLADYLRRPEIPHTAYPSESGLWHRLLETYRRLNLSIGKGG
jgi:N-acetyl sugar amidotransferase